MSKNNSALVEGEYESYKVEINDCQGNNVRFGKGDYIPITSYVDIPKKEKVYLAIKRIVDILGSLCVLLFFPLIILGVKIGFLATGNKDSIWYKQLRLGKDGRVFTIYKFKTMVTNGDEVLEAYFNKFPEKRVEYDKNKKLVDDPRVTTVGKILRKTSIDEFPQFINVFKGDMSLIGNRPYTLDEVEKIGDNLGYIVATTPGISGLWQTSGRSNISFQERVEIEARYSKECSLWMDVKLFLKTFLIVFKQEGAV